MKKIKNVIKAIIEVIVIGGISAAVALVYPFGVIESLWRGRTYFTALNEAFRDYYAIVGCALMYTITRDEAYTEMGEDWLEQLLEDTGF